MSEANQNTPQRVKIAVARLIAVFVVFVPPIWAAYGLLTHDGAWLTSETITVTTPAPPLSTFLMVVFVWFMVFAMAGYMALWGPRP